MGIANGPKIHWLLTEIWAEKNVSCKPSHFPVDWKQPKCFKLAFSTFKNSYFYARFAAIQKVGDQFGSQGMVAAPKI
jgi:hypothetical protein